MTLVFIKLGGSILTDKTRPEALDEQTLHRVVAELAAIRAAQPALRLMVGHGGGSFGHHWARRYNTAQGISGPEGWQGFARVADAMARLNRHVVGALLDAGVPAIGIPPSASGRSNSGALVELADSPLDALIAAGVVPVIYGDVVVDERQGCAIISTETLFAYLAPRLGPERIVLVGEAAVYTADPRRDTAAKPIVRIDSANYESVLALLGGSHGVDVTGGMRSKVEAMWRLVNTLPGLTVQIVGPQPEPFRAAVLGEILPFGTTIAV